MCFCLNSCVPKYPVSYMLTLVLYCQASDGLSLHSAINYKASIYNQEQYHGLLDMHKNIPDSYSQREGGNPGNPGPSSQQ